MLLHGTHFVTDLFFSLSSQILSHIPTQSNLTLEIYILLCLFYCYVFLLHNKRAECQCFYWEPERKVLKNFTYIENSILEKVTVPRDGGEKEFCLQLTGVREQFGKT